MRAPRPKPRSRPRSKTEAAEPASLQDRSRGAGLAPRPKLRSRPRSKTEAAVSNKADQSAFDVLEGVVATKSTPDGVDLKLSNYSTTAAMNGSIASANNATLARPPTTASRRWWTSTPWT